MRYFLIKNVILRLVRECVDFSRDSGVLEMILTILKIEK